MAAQRAGLISDALAARTHISCSWKDPTQRFETDWYKFQEAIRFHLDERRDVFAKRLPELAQSIGPGTCGNKNNRNRCLNPDVYPSGGSQLPRRPFLVC
jgi:hypothetical protein